MIDFSGVTYSRSVSPNSRSSTFDLPEDHRHESWLPAQLESYLDERRHKTNGQRVGRVGNSPKNGHLCSNRQPEVLSGAPDSDKNPSRPLRLRGLAFFIRGTNAVHAQHQRPPFWVIALLKLVELCLSIGKMQAVAQCGVKKRLTNMKA